MQIFFNNQADFFQKTTREKDYAMPYAHFHDKHELYILEKGVTRYLIGDNIYLLEPFDMIFVPKGVFHKTNSEKNQKTERILFTFDDGFAGDGYQKYIEELKDNNYIRIPPEKHHILKEIINRIEREERHKSKDYRELQKLLLCELLVLISRYRTKEEIKNFDGSYITVKEAVKYISENYSSELGLDFLAKKFALSPSHFSRLFNEITGIGINEYINNIRITAAEKLLIDTNLPITQIATDCGFNDSNYFATVFKKIKGITPKKFSMLNRS